VTHVRDALSRLHACVATGQGAEWQKLNDSIRALYTMEDERQIFDALVQRASTGDAPEAEDAPCGSVELF
jgi:hypothetical protein